MRIAIISDIHSNLEALQTVLNDLSTRKVECILCLGDIVGYNANPIECIQLLRDHDALCVAGNHDRGVTEQIPMTDFNHTAARAVSWTRCQLGTDALAFLSSLPSELCISNIIVAVHGALHHASGRETVRLDNDKRRRLSLDSLTAHPSRARICAFGHTHQLGVYELHGGVVRKLTGEQIHLSQDSWYLINPGSVGQPSTTDLRATYLILDSTLNELTTHWITYDTAIPFSKTRRARLMPIWAILPAPIRSAIRRLPKPVRTALRWGTQTLNL